MDKPHQHHIHALTGIRFVAALGVFIHHMLGRLGVTYIRWPFGDGGVTFFFVLSGFILTYVYCDRLTGYRQLPRFYFTRWARIWPLHFVTLIISVVFFYRLAYLFGDEELTGKLIVNALLLHSWVPNYSWVFAYNGVSWSISTEAFFYLMFPLLVIKRGQFWVKYLVLTVAIAVYVLTVNAYADAINQTGWASVAPMIHCFPFVRLFEFMTGMAVGYLFLANPNLAVSKRNFWKDSLIEFTAIGLLLAYYHWQFNFPRTVELSEAFDVLVAKSGSVLFYAILIFFFSFTRGIVGRLMSSRVMVYLGEISFAFYMIHFIVIRFLSEQSFAPIPEYYGGLLVAAFLLSIASASLLYHFVEMPAKSGLLAWYDYGILASIFKLFRGIGIGIVVRGIGIAVRGIGIALRGVGIALRGVGKTLLKPSLWVPVVTIAATLWVLQGWSLDRTNDKEVVRVVKQTELFDHPIHFGRDAVLFGLISIEKESSITLKMTWVKRRNEGRRRLLEIFSADDQLLYTCSDKHKNYVAAPIGEVFVETISIPRDRFAKGSRLCLGFYGKEEEMAEVSGGPRSFYNRRLNIYSPEDAD